MPNTNTLVVMQPTFLPWAGYFNLIASADDFVFLDDVQLEKQSWQTRNRLIFSGRVHWITIPIKHVGLSQTIGETSVAADPVWKKKLLKSFKQNYGRHPYFADAEEVLNELLNHHEESLAAINQAVIRFVAARLRLPARLHRSSELKVYGARSERLLSLCEHFQANIYLSPVGSAEYLEEDGFAARTTTQLRFQSFVPKGYEQFGQGEFISSLSILDVLANLGWEQTRKYVYQEMQ